MATQRQRDERVILQLLSQALRPLSAAELALWAGEGLFPALAALVQQGRVRGTPKDGARVYALAPRERWREADHFVRRSLRAARSRGDALLILAWAAREPVYGALIEHAVVLRDVLPAGLPLARAALRARDLGRREDSGP